MKFLEKFDFAIERKDVLTHESTYIQVRAGGSTHV